MAAQHGAPRPSSPAAIAHPTQPFLTRTFLVFSPQDNTFQRKTLSVWNPHQGETLDFEWRPASKTTNGATRPSGSGTVVWRVAASAPYDRKAVRHIYKGSLKDGMADGQGTMRSLGGAFYKGQWSLGQPHGQGVAQNSAAESYDGSFVHGTRHGQGLLIKADGETYSGPFVDGVPHGLGKTKLPNGACYESRWTAGLEDKGSRATRLAQLGIDSAFAQAPSLTITPELSGSQESVTHEQYELLNQTSAFVIRPSAEGNLLNAWKGTGPITWGAEDDLYYDDTGPSFVFHDLGTPSLSVAIRNTSGSLVPIEALTLEVEVSETDTTPAISLSTVSCRDGRAYQPALQFDNAGWGPITSATIRYAFGKTGKLQQTRIFDETLAWRQGRVAHSVESALTALGVDTAALGKIAGPVNSDPKSTECPDETRRLDALIKAGGLGQLAEAVYKLLDGDDRPEGTLGFNQAALLTHAVGTISYRWQTSDGIEKSLTRPFAAPIGLGSLGGGFAEDGSAEVGNDYPDERDVRLTLDRRNYTAPLSFSRVLSPGAEAKIDIKFHTDKSSRHVFRIAAKLGIGLVIRSKPFDMLVYRRNGQQKEIPPRPWSFSDD